MECLKEDSSKDQEDKEESRQQPRASKQDGFKPSEYHIEEINLADLTDKE